MWIYVEFSQDATKCDHYAGDNFPGVDDER